MEETERMSKYSSPEWRERVATTRYGWREESRKYRPRYDASWLRKIIVLIIDGLYGLYLLIVRSIPVIVDVVYHHYVLGPEERLPNSIRELMDLNTFARLSGRKVLSIQCADQKEQHANSAERAWLLVRYADGPDGVEEECYVFAKCHAGDLLVRSIMSAFGIYRNELHAYTELHFPIPTPRFHVARWTPSRFSLVLDDLSRQGVYFPNIYENTIYQKSPTNQ